MKAFCFCGTQGYNTDLNSIETLEIGREGEWKTLPLNDTIAKTFSLACVQLEDKIIVFGGESAASYNMYILSEEGELVGDLS